MSVHVAQGKWQLNNYNACLSGTITDTPYERGSVGWCYVVPTDGDHMEDFRCWYDKSDSGEYLYSSWGFIRLCVSFAQRR